MSLFNFFNAYPYTEFQKINLDWIMKKLKELESQYNTVIDAAAAATAAATAAEAAAAEATQTIGDAEAAIAEATAATTSATQAANTATQAANTATQQAQAAQQTAGTALSTAQNANTAAQSANSTAQSANSTAQSANTAAQEASAAAAQAVQTANGVASTANTALSTAQLADNRLVFGPQAVGVLTPRTVSGGSAPWCSVVSSTLLIDESLAFDRVRLGGYVTVQVENSTAEAPNGNQIIDTDFVTHYEPDSTANFNLGVPWFVTSTAPGTSATADAFIRSGSTNVMGVARIDTSGNLSLSVNVTGAVRGKYLTMFIPKVQLPYPT